MSMNKIERIRALFKGEKTDCVPAAFWFHYGDKVDVPHMIEAHLKTWRETDADLIKVMMDYICLMETKVQVPGDWKHLRFPGVESPVFHKLNDVLKGIVDRAGTEVLAFQTMFSPYKMAEFSFGVDLMTSHAKEAPDSVAAGVAVIGEALQAWADAFLQSGAAGIYYSAQFSEPDRFSRDEWTHLVRATDLPLLDMVTKQGKDIILHICGEPEYNWGTHPQWYADYPASIVNWSVKDTHLNMAEGRKVFNKPVLGGMHNKANILKGPDTAIVAEARSVIQAYTQACGNTRGFMLGADCTIQGEGIRHDFIRAAVDTAHKEMVS
jgi:uroporphyrinogen decarboxylase